VNTQRRHWVTAPRFTPLLGALIGAVGGGVYWLGAQIWPTSIAVVLSMLATALLSARTGAGTGTSSGTGPWVPGSESLGFVFAVLVKYNALMALSAANLPYPLPANLALGLIMIAGQASSRALVVSVLASPTHPASKPASHGDLGIALAVGFAPAALIGIPGLIGLVAAIVARIAFIAFIKRNRPSVAAAELDMTQQLTEVCFYLGALASWAYI
jgi:adenosylcobinamide-GDP ribazoletransferase